MIRWERTTPDTYEILTLCTLDDSGTYVVQVTNADDAADPLVGLCYLDGETANVSYATWTPVAEVTPSNAACLAAVEANFDPAFGALSRLL